MKLTKEELLTRVNTLEVDDEIKVSLMEDIDDTIGDNANIVDDTINEQLKREKEELQWKYDDLLARYKERFLTGDDNEGDNDDNDENVDISEVVDVTEI